MIAQTLALESLGDQRSVVFSRGECLAVHALLGFSIAARRLSVKAKGFRFMGSGVDRNPHSLRRCVEVNKRSHEVI